MKNLKKNEVWILITAVLLGVLIMVQARSYEDVSDVISRNSRSDVFREIQILKTTNENLEDEISGLEDQLEKITNNQEALNSVREEIDKYMVLTGKVDISGPGVGLKLDGDIEAIWLTDTVNELFSTGAEAVSINSIRLTNKTIGFDTIPSGQILLNGVILNKPYVIEAIGDKTVLEQTLNQAEGILERMGRSISDTEINLEQKDFIKMEKVL
jgi:uncharacterized protein YlxW (UPF0749 family)